MRGAGRPHGAGPSCVYGCWRARALAPVAARSVGSLAVAYRSCTCGAELVNWPRRRVRVLQASCGLLARGR